MAASAYVDEHVEGKYEEIVNHLHKALSSTEEDERDSRVNTRSPWRQSPLINCVSCLDLNVSR